MKVTQAAIVLVALLAATAFAAVGSAGDASGDQPVPGEWTIPAGETMIVRPGTVFHGGGRLIVQGILDVRGDAGAPASFLVPVEIDGGALTGSHAVFSPPRGIALDVRAGRVDLADAVFSSGDGALVAERDPIAIVIERATFTGYGEGAVRLTASGSVKIANALFDGNVGAVNIDLLSSAPSEYAFTSNVFRGPGNAMTIRSHTGAPDHVRSIVLSANTFEGGDLNDRAAEHAALRVRGLAPTTEVVDAPIPPLIQLRENTFRDHGVAIFLERQGFEFASEGDAIVRNTIGVIVREVDGARFTRTTFANGAWDIQSDGLDSRLVLSEVTYDPARVFFGAGDEIVADGSVLAYAVGGTLLASILAAAFLLFTNSGWDILQRFLIAPFYTRLTREDLVANPNRQNILQCVKESPGVHMRGIASELNMSFGTLSYHVHRLEKEGYLTSRVRGIFKQYYSAEGGVKRSLVDTPLATELRGAERDIFDYMAAHPGCTQSSIATALGLSRQALHYHVKKLENRSFITKVAQGRETLCYVRTAES